MGNSKWLSVCFIADGPRGGGKTLLLTIKQHYELIAAYYLGHNVWSNYPVGFYHQDVRDGKWVYLYPQPLNMEAFYVMDKGLSKGWVFIDEIDQWLDRQEWQATTQKLINKVLTLIRHRQLSLAGTIQNFGWLNSRGQFQVDTEASCRDARFSPWGRSRRLEGGEVINLIWRDRSGINSGYTFEENNRIWKNNIIGARRFWNIYDTYYEFDPMEAKTKYHLKVKTKEIDFTGNGGAEVTHNELHSEKKGDNETLVSDYVWELCQSENKVPSAELFTLVKNKGFSGDSKELREIMTSLGYRRNSRLTHYILNDKVGAGV